MGGGVGHPPLALALARALRLRLHAAGRLRRRRRACPALAWLQDSVYAGCAVSVTPTWLFGRPGALLARTGTVPPAPRDDSPP